MVKPLKVGVAGLGTVGAALIAQIAHQREALAVRCGRPIEIVAVSARSRAKKRGIDLKNAKWFADPVALARAPGIDVFVELIGGAGNPVMATVVYDATDATLNGGVAVWDIYSESTATTPSIGQSKFSLTCGDVGMLGADDCFLADDLVEVLRAVLPIERGHGAILAPGLNASTRWLTVGKEDGIELVVPGFDPRNDVDIRPVPELVGPMMLLCSVKGSPGRWSWTGSRGRPLGRCTSSGIGRSRAWTCLP